MHVGKQTAAPQLGIPNTIHTDAPLSHSLLCPDWPVLRARIALDILRHTRLAATVTIHQIDLIEAITVASKDPSLLIGVVIAAGNAAIDQ